MALPKKISSGVRYLPSSAYNCLISFWDPDQGQASDGTPSPAVAVASGIHANIQPWRTREEDKSQIRVGVSTYKIVIRYPKTYSLDTGMQIKLRNQLHNIESFYDPDGLRVELHIWTFCTNDTVVNP
jgi:SPP1 family predicted phage head-tail adaptor